MTDRMEVDFMGRNLGTCEGWDFSDEIIMFYQFAPRDGIDLKVATSLNLDISKGIYEIIGSQGEVLSTGDIIPLLAKLEPVPA